MTPEQTSDTRTRLLEAAAELIAESPGQDVPLRAICERVGVRLSTLYHYFGSKEGLLEKVVEHGFDLYLGVKGSGESSGDPVQDLRDGWDAHVEFGLEHPGFYALMYGQVAPGSRPAAQERPTAMLLDLMARIDEQERLVVPPAQAAAHVLAANVGVTLRQIVLDEPDPELSAAVREGTIAAVTGVGRTDPDALPDVARELLGLLPADGGGLGKEESALLRAWLLRLSGA